MSLTVQQLLADAKRLSGRLREHDASADNVISNAQEVLKAVDAMRQYQEDIDNLNCIAHNRPRAQLVLGIQQENRHIRQLQHENKELRAALEEHQNAIELIMSKYRQHITCLVHSSKVDNNAIKQQKSRLLQDRADKICEMASVMNQSIQIDEERYAKEQELMSRLLTENKGLREMLEISSKNGSRTDPLIGPKVITRSCQTDELASDINCLVTSGKISDLSISDKDKDRGSATNHMFLQQKELSSNDEPRKRSEYDSLSDTKDKSNGTIGPSTSSPAVSHFTLNQEITTSSSSTSTSHIAISAIAISTNAAGSGLSTSMNDSKSEENLFPSRPISAASDSSESSTESSTTSEDEDQEVTFNTIKRRQTKVNVISPKSASPQPHNDINSTLNSKHTTTSNCENLAHCDETKVIIDKNGDNVKSNDRCAVIDLKSNDGLDNKENGVKSQSKNNAEAKVNGDSQTRTPSVAPIDSVIKSDDKNTKKEQKTTKSATSINSTANSLDEQQPSLPGINLPARFKKANSKNKKSTIRKSDLRNNGCGSDPDKKVSK